MENYHYHNLIHETRLVFGVALTGIMASLTHNFYLNIRPVSLARLTDKAISELETHQDDSYNTNQYVADPRHVRGIRRDGEW